MGIEVLLIITGVVLKWALHPGVVGHQRAIGNWCLYLGGGIVVLEILLFIGIVVLGIGATKHSFRRF